VKCLKPRLATPTARGWKPDEQRGNRHQRGYGSTWDKTRVRIMQRDNGLCQPHLKRGEVAIGNEVDHITSKAEGRSLGWTSAQIEADSNLQTICTACHLEKTARESMKGGG
jgi:5-methylcytosine-specific restriction protein A